MRRFVAFVVVAAGTGACGDTTAGKLCQPGDATVCGDGFQCLTFCDAATGPQSVCTPSFGSEAGDDFDNEALIDDKVTFGQLGNVRVFDGNLRIELSGVKGVALPLVEEVHGNLSVVGTDIECLSLPRLKTVDGRLTLELNEKLERNELASLQTAGDVIVTDNPALAELLWTSASRFAGDVVIDGNTSLDIVNFGSLQTVGGDFALRGDNLRQLHIDVLEDVAGCVDVEFAAGACAVPPALDGVTCCDATLRRDDCVGCP